MMSSRWAIDAAFRRKADNRVSHVKVLIQRFCATLSRALAGQVFLLTITTGAIFSTASRLIWSL